MREGVSALYTLWLPITDFTKLRNEIQARDVIVLENSANSTWSWIIFNFKTAKITIDSLGFIYLDKIDSIELKNSCLEFLEEFLNRETKITIFDTFLNRQIGYNNNENSEKELFIKFLDTVLIGFNPLSENIKLEYIYARLYVDLKEQDTDSTLQKINSKYKISSIKKMKFSFRKEEERDEKFQTILNRNFKNLLEKSVHYTNSLFFEKGELYELSIIKKDFNQNSDFVNFELFVNKEDKSQHRQKLFNQIFKKAIQDTIEERTILHFLKITRRKYLRKIIDEIGVKNELLKQLNSYLLDDLEQSIDKGNTTRGSDDELTIEIFIQNLLQAIPKFQIIDANLKEAYYVKIGNTTTTLQVSSNETIVGTLDYGKWKSLVKFFMDTASKVNESLTMYHQNKTLKELEDISYNANYQADIEDIRELQKNKTVLLDEDSKKIFLFIAVAALAGEAPLIESSLFWEILNQKELWDKFYINLADMIINSILYMFIIFGIIKPIFLDKNEPTTNDKGEYSLVKRIWLKLNSCCLDIKKLNIYYFDESDYDKHEHRSNKLLLNYNTQTKEFDKQKISYNNSISSYDLIKKLKELDVKQKIDTNIFTYGLFPKLLKETPIDESNTHVYRENYRISGNNRVATKVMYRYKLSKLTLEDFLKYMKEDAFMQGYTTYLETQGFSIEEHYELLEPLKSASVYLTLYIVYSFVLKINEVKQGKEYTYTIAKDQFRVHYHINKLEYQDRVEFEAKQDALAKLIDIYFLARLKRIGN